jgi:hypothetical protein
MVSDVLSVKDCGLDKSSDMVVVGRVKDLVAISTHGHQPCRPQLGEMLRHRRWSCLHVIGELVDRMFGVEQRPENAKAGVLG